MAYENNDMVMPVSPMYGNNNGFMGNDGAWWLLILLFALGGNWGNGFGGGTNSEVSRGFDQASINANFSGIQSSLADMAMAQQNCCCENRAAIADLKYTIATEACADRAAVSDGVQAILDKMCQQEIDALKTQNANLQTQINLAALQASQAAQTAAVLEDNARQTTALEQYLNPVPIPAYVVQNPNCCSQNTGCGGCGF